MLCKLKACRKCDGDLILDGDEWRCWQCGHYYYPKPPATEPPPYPDRTDRPMLTLGRPMAGKLRRRTRSALDVLPKCGNSLDVERDFDRAPRGEAGAGYVPGLSIVGLNV